MDEKTRIKTNSFNALKKNFFVMANEIKQFLEKEL